MFATLSIQHDLLQQKINKMKQFTKAHKKKSEEDAYRVEWVLGYKKLLKEDRICAKEIANHIHNCFKGEGIGEKQAQSRRVSSNTSNYEENLYT
jgi:hypothetical protein